MDDEIALFELDKDKYLAELDEFIKNVDQTLLRSCETLGWDLEKTVEETEPYVTCPFNEGHRVPERTIHKHLQKCEWKSLGYTDECIPLPESALPLESPSTIKIDMALQHQILQTAKQKDPTLNIGPDEKLAPKTADRFLSDYTADEKLILYDYVIANTKGPDAGEDISTDINNDEKPKDKEPSKAVLELLAAERNLKRRRAKYRGVHTNKKSHLEIMKEVIEQQMEMLKEHVSEKSSVSNYDYSLDSRKKLEKDYESKKKYSHHKDDSKSSYKNDDPENFSKKYYSNKDRDRDYNRDKYDKNDYSKEFKSYKKYDRENYQEKSRDHRSPSTENDKYERQEYSKRDHNKSDFKKIKNDRHKNDHKEGNEDYDNSYDKNLVEYEKKRKKVMESDSEDKDRKHRSSKKKHHKHHKSSHKRKHHRSQSREKHKKSKHK